MTSHPQLHGHNILVIDTECAFSAAQCRYCDRYADMFDLPPACPDDRGHYEREWNDKLALGLSIGCAYSYLDDQLLWFDGHTLEAFVARRVATQALLVSFNGLGHDFPLIQALLRQQGDALCALADSFEALTLTSYDILAAIWTTYGRGTQRGLNTLDALCQANALPSKEMDGAQTPRLWQQGRYSEVIQYCQNDVLRTKALFELIWAGQPLWRRDGQQLMLPQPVLEALRPDKE
jgi:hypothetical protein